MGGVETGKANAIDTDAAQGIIRYIGFIPKFSAILHKTAAKIIMVDEFDVTCVTRLMTIQQMNIMIGAEMPLKVWLIYNAKNGDSRLPCRLAILTPINFPNPEDVIPAAIAKPPPRRKITPQPILLAICFHVINGFAVL